MRVSPPASPGQVGNGSAKAQSSSRILKHTLKPRVGHHLDLGRWILWQVRRNRDWIAAVSIVDTAGNLL